MKIATSYSNFARGKVDHDINGRFDLPIYTTSLDEIVNFFTNFKGTAIFRTGWVSEILFQDCAFIEFKFSYTQNYICVLYANKMRFLTYDANNNFGWVLDGGAAILEINTPYTLAQSKEIAKRQSYSQNADVMVIACEGVEPRKLTRTSANSFTLKTYPVISEPWALTYQGTKAITAITQAANAQITVVGHGYSVGDRIRILAVVGMTGINDYTVTVESVVDADNFTIDLNTTSFSAYSSGGTANKRLTADFPRCCLFYKRRLYFAATSNTLTGLWGSEEALYDIFTLPSSPTTTSAFKFVLADIAQKIDWLFKGGNSLIVGAADGIVAVNGGSVGSPINATTIDAIFTDAEPCNSTYPLSKDGYIFYEGLDSRNIYYFSYDLLSEKFISEDSNILSYDITSGGLGKMRFKKDRNNLIYALNAEGDWVTLNFNKKENIIGWHDHNSDDGGTYSDLALITDNNGTPQIFALALRGGSYYIERQEVFTEFSKRSAFFTSPTSNTETNRRIATVLDDEAYYRKIGEELKTCVYLDNAITYNDYKTSTITYNPTLGTITAGASSFSSGDVGKHIVYKTATGYEYGRFEITAYNSATSVDVEVLQAPTSNVYSSWYLSFDGLTGLNNYNNKTVSIVADGSYLGEFEVTSNAIADLGAQYTSVVIGYKYKGFIKSFALGFQAQGVNTQSTFKNIIRVGIRTVHSMGGQFGSSLYKLEPIQLLSQTNLNYLPPFPLDGTKIVDLVDDYKIDKYFYLVKDEPTPFFATSIILEADYSS